MTDLTTDGANVMMCDNYSFKTLVVKDIPHLLSVECTIHNLALGALKTASVLPESIEKFIKAVYMYLKYSSKRTAKFLMIQELLELPAHKILNICDMRWLSLMQCVKRFIEQLRRSNVLFQEESPKIRIPFERMKPLYR